LQGGAERGPVRHRPERGHGEARAAQKLLLPEPVLGDAERLQTGPDGLYGGDLPDRLGRDVLELQGDDVHGAGEGAGRVEVLVGGCPFVVGEAAGGAVRLGGEDVDAVAYPAGGKDEHPSELAAA
jgi:hypothetical protein